MHALFLIVDYYFFMIEISPKGKKKLEYKSKSKSSVKLPLIGKTIYLDVKDAKYQKQLQSDLKTLGAVSKTDHS